MAMTGITSLAGANAGAVNKPVGDIVPKSEPSDHVTSVNGSPFTVAENCCVWFVDSVGLWASPRCWVA